MDVGATIKRIRKQRKLSQDKLSEQAGITQTYLSQIEANQKEPNLSTLKAIAKAFDLPLPILFFMSITEEDIPKNKRTAYSLIGPSINSFINEFFSI